MEITRTFHAPDRSSWRSWLQEHHRTEPDVWLVFHRKATGVPGVSYNHAVEEALCFGWIDSTRKGIDAERTAQRFSPRRPGSPFSQTNRERLRKLVAAGKVADHVLPAVEQLLAEPFPEPADIMDALRSDPVGWANFLRYSDSYRRIRIAYVDGSRGDPEAFEKRLRHLIRMNAADRQFGYGIEEYY